MDKCSKKTRVSVVLLTPLKNPKNLIGFTQDFKNVKPILLFIKL